MLWKDAEIKVFRFPDEARESLRQDHTGGQILEIEDAIEWIIAFRDREGPTKEKRYANVRKFITAFHEMVRAWEEMDPFEKVGSTRFFPDNDPDEDRESPREMWTRDLENLISYGQHFLTANDFIFRADPPKRGAPVHVPEKEMCWSLARMFKKWGLKITNSKDETPSNFTRTLATCYAHMGMTAPDTNPLGKARNETKKYLKDVKQKGGNK